MGYKRVLYFVIATFKNMSEEGVADLYANERLEEQTLDRTVLWPEDNFVTDDDIYDKRGWQVVYRYSIAYDENFRANDLREIFKLIKKNPGLSMFSVLKRYEDIILEDDYDLKNCHRYTFRIFKEKFFEFIVSLDRLNMEKGMFSSRTCANVYYFDFDPDYITKIYRNVGVFLIDGKIKFGCYREHILQILNHEPSFNESVRRLHKKRKHKKERNARFFY